MSHLPQLGQVAFFLPNNMRNERVTFRLTNEEIDTLDGLAGVLKRSRSSVIRLLIDSAAEKLLSGNFSIPEQRADNDSDEPEAR